MPRLKSPAPFRLRRLGLLVLCALLLVAPAVVGQEEKPPAVPPKAQPKGQPEAQPQSQPKPPPPATAASEAKRRADIQRLRAKAKEIDATQDMPEAVRTAAAEHYRGAAASLESAISLQKEADAFKAEAESAPVEAKRIREALEKAADPSTVQVQVPPDADSKAIERLLAAEKSRIAELRSQGNQLDNVRRAQAGRPTGVQKDIAAARTLLGELAAAEAKAPPAEENPILSAARKERRDARQAATLALLAKLEHEAASWSVRDDLTSVRREQVARRLTLAEERTKQLTAAFDKRFKEEQERAATEAAKALQGQAGKYPLIVDLARGNQELLRDQTDLTPRANKAKEAQAQLDKLRGEIKLRRESTAKKLDAAGYSRDMGEVLVDELDRLPRWEAVIREQVAQQGSIALTSLKEAHLKEELAGLSNIVQVLREMTEGVETSGLSAGLQEEIRKRARLLLETRRELLQTLTGIYTDYSAALVKIKTDHEAIDDEMDGYAALLQENLLWMPSGPPAGIESFSKIGSALRWITAAKAWAGVRDTLIRELRSDHPLTLVIGLLVLLLLVLRWWFRRVIVASSKLVGDPERDHVKYTVRAVVLTVLMALPEPLLVFYLAALIVNAKGFPAAVGGAFETLAVSLWMFRFWWVFFSSYGVAVKHFEWEESACLAFRNQLLKLVLVAVPASFVMWVTLDSADRSYFHSLGRLGTVVNSIALSWFCYRVVNPKGVVLRAAYESRSGGLLARHRYAWFILATVVPLVMCVLALMGYQYSAVLFLHRFGRSLGVIVFAFLGYTLMVRWAATNRRRLAFVRAAEKAAAEGDRGSIEGRIPVMDPSAVDAQSRYLFRTLTILLAILGVWSVWSEIIPALAVVDDIQLWSYSSLVAGQEHLTEFTLGSLIGFLIAVVVTVVATRNIPGLLEIGILRRLKLDAGARYAISTLSRYLITTVGIVVAFQMLGFRWEHIQWLVAAMGVGLGFGLQEIFANFVCGLIIFFERRVRVGDVVTVDTITGTITKIRILATTITDWDRKEFVVPNKEFVTGRLLNWTLSDQVNRMVVEIGVPHGTNTEEVREIMLEAARKHPSVLTDPGPLATLEEIGDSSLMVFLRCYLPDLSNRLTVRSQLHEAISAAFREKGISIARPQRDMNIRSADAGSSLTGPTGGAGAEPPETT